jgi:hypothetical protein
MIAGRSFSTFAIVFAVAFAILYLLSVENNWALFTYHPALEEFGFLVQKPKDVRLVGHVRFGRPSDCRGGSLCPGQLGKSVLERLRLGDPARNDVCLCLYSAWIFY